jgi:DNA-binding MarR family transcriptional regulator
MVNYYNRAFEPLGLTAQQMIALGVLLQEDDLRLGVFATRARIGKAAAVTMINRLEAMGLVTRRTASQDGRLTIIKLTDKAWALAPRANRIAAELEKRIETTLGKETLESMLKGLSLVRDLQL